MRISAAVLTLICAGFGPCALAYQVAVAATPAWVLPNGCLFANCMNPNIIRKAALQPANEGPLAEATIYVYGGPESRTRCIAYGIDVPGVIKTCTQWATDFQQHGLFLQMWGPPDVDKGQVQSIKDSYLIAGQIPFLPAVATIDGIAAVFNEHYETMEAGFQSCVSVTAGLGRLAVPSFKLEVIRRDFW